MYVISLGELSILHKSARLLTVETQPGSYYPAVLNLLTTRSLAKKRRSLPLPQPQFENCFSRLIQFFFFDILSLNLTPSRGSYCEPKLDAWEDCS